MHTIILLAAMQAGPVYTDYPSNHPVAGQTAWLCNSRINGSWPKIGRWHHESVAFCGKGQLPILAGTKPALSNPACAFLGTQFGRSKFWREPQRIDVTCQPAKLPVSIVRERVKQHDKPYRFPGYTCQESAKGATGYGPWTGGPPRTSSKAVPSPWSVSSPKKK